MNTLENKELLVKIETDQENTEIVSDKGIFEVKKNGQTIFAHSDYEITRYVAFGW